jgi:hypothetical protein
MPESDSYNRLVLYRLDELAKGLERVEAKVEGLVIDVAMLKVKAGVWGATAGMIPAAITILLSLTGVSHHA